MERWVSTVTFCSLSFCLLGRVIIVCLSMVCVCTYGVASVYSLRKSIGTYFQLVTSIKKNSNNALRCRDGYAKSIQGVDGAMLTREGWRKAEVKHT